jgi:hypothetical protein
VSVSQVVQFTEFHLHCKKPFLKKEGSDDVSLKKYTSTFFSRQAPNLTAAVKKWSIIANILP